MEGEAEQTEKDHGERDSKRAGGDRESESVESKSKGKMTKSE